MNSSSSNRKGFTLVEVIVALAIGAGFVAILSQILLQFRDGHVRASGVASTIREQAAAERLIRGAIENMIQPAPGGDSNLARPLSGGPGAMSFTTRPPVAVMVASMHWMLGVRTDDSGRSALIACIGRVGAPCEERVLVGEVSAVRFSYFFEGKAYPHPPAPGLDRISIEWVKEDRLVRIIASPRIDIPGECRVDPESLRCRRS